MSANDNTFAEEPSEYESLAHHLRLGPSPSFSPSETSSNEQKSSQLRAHSMPSSFDPYSPDSRENTVASSLLDDAESTTSSRHSATDEEAPLMSTPAWNVPGTAAYLEIEEAPRTTSVQSWQGDAVVEPIRTSSGLLLTHRKSSTTPFPKHETATSHNAVTHNSTGKSNHDDHDFKKERASAQTHTFRVPERMRQRLQNVLEMGEPSGQDSDVIGSFSLFPQYRKSPHTMTSLHTRRLVQFWMISCGVLATLILGAIVHAWHAPTSNQTELATDASQINSINMASQGQQNLVQQQILLLPRENLSQEFALPQEQSLQMPPKRNLAVISPAGDNFLPSLRQEFDLWASKHKKQYSSHNEKERRFSIWSQNHHRTNEKNKRHGKCPLTKQHVFGASAFHDLEPHEFRQRFLTGYSGPKADDRVHAQKTTMPVLDPTIHTPRIHQELHDRLLKKGHPAYTSRSSKCKWYDVSCWIRYIFHAAGIGFGGTMEPKYDSETYPNSVDWRSDGAVTPIKTQGECGACWAITAVETVESATFMATGQLYDLSETEVITCDDSCQMCSGGWPQNAFEFIMEQGGLPLEDDLPYDADFLLALTGGLEGTSNTYTEDSVKAYAETICPAGTRGGSGSQSHDSQDNGNNGSSSFSRYGAIDGYGYATDRCLCYSDGSGCDCDAQDEALAVRNVASYGPATVCLEASLWQDYMGGIITAESGCGSSFMEMNHCVQVVGYAFADASDVEQEDGQGEDRNSQSRSHSGSGDSSSRIGYWIVRNQWSEYWGMNGYAYVAMGENTCGILNDMTQAYFK